jgi:hypothetical protein
MERDHVCPRCGKNDWELKTRQSKYESGPIRDTSLIEEWCCAGCDYYEIKK